MVAPFGCYRGISFLTPVPWIRMQFQGFEFVVIPIHWKSADWKGVEQQKAFLSLLYFTELIRIHFGLPVVVGGDFNREFGTDSVDLWFSNIWSSIRTNFVRDMILATSSSSGSTRPASNRPPVRNVEASTGVSLPNILEDDECAKEESEANADDETSGNDVEVLEGKVSPLGCDLQKRFFQYIKLRKQYCYTNPWGTVLWPLLVSINQHGRISIDETGTSRNVFYQPE